MFSVKEYPFYVVRYSCWDFGLLCKRISLYSSLLSMMLDGGLEKVGPCALVEQ